MSAHALSKILMRGLGKGFNSVKNLLKIEDEPPNFEEKGKKVTAGFLTSLLENG